MTTTGHASHWQEVAEQTMRENAELRKDTERLDFLMRVVSGAEFRRIGITYSAGCRREDLDRYRLPRD